MTHFLLASKVTTVHVMLKLLLKLSKKLILVKFGFIRKIAQIKVSLIYSVEYILLLNFLSESNKPRRSSLSSPSTLSISCSTRAKSFTALSSLHRLTVEAASPHSQFLRMFLTVLRWKFDIGWCLCVMTWTLIAITFWTRTNHSKIVEYQLTRTGSWVACSACGNETKLKINQSYKVISWKLTVIFLHIAFESYLYQRWEAPNIFFFALDSVRRLHLDEQLLDSCFHQPDFQKKFQRKIFNNDKTLWGEEKKPRSSNVPSHHL